MNEIEKLKEKQEELKKEIEKLGTQIQELEEQEKKCKRWRGKRDEKYWFISESGEVYNTIETSDERDKASYEISNYFRTEEEAKKMIEKIKIYTQLKDLALRLNGGREVDWANANQKKHYIVCDSRNKLECGYSYWARPIGQIYCLNSFFLDVAKQEIGEENLKKLFE